MNIQAKARVTVTVELEVASLHGGMLGHEMFDVAAQSAIRRVTEACREFATVVGKPRIECVMVQEKP